MHCPRGLRLSTFPVCLSEARATSSSWRPPHSRPIGSIPPCFKPLTHPQRCRIIQTVSRDTTASLGPPRWPLHSRCWVATIITRPSSTPRNRTSTSLDGCPVTTPETNLALPMRIRCTMREQYMGTEGTRCKLGAMVAVVLDRKTTALLKGRTRMTLLRCIHALRPTTRHTNLLVVPRHRYRACPTTSTSTQLQPLRASPPITLSNTRFRTRNRSSTWDTIHRRTLAAPVLLTPRP